MASARHLRGSILSRVRGLLETEAISTKPLWYDIVDRFRSERLGADFPPPKGRPTTIVFEQDIIRRQSRLRIPDLTQEPLNLFGKLDEVDKERLMVFGDSLPERFINYVHKLQKAGVEEEDSYRRGQAWYEDQMQVAMERVAKQRIRAREQWEKKLKTSFSVSNEEELEAVDKSVDFHSLLNIHDSGETPKD